jgi:ADP-heptose:LPS heptosyltransferase
VDPERILLVRLSHLGDVVHALPLFHALRACHGSARIAWVVQKEYLELIAPLPGLDRPIAFDRSGGIAAWRALRSELRRFRPDLAVDAQGNLKSAAVLLLSGAVRRMGAHTSDRREPLARLASNEHAERAPRGVAHALDKVDMLIRAACGEPAELRFDLGLSEPELRRGEELVERYLPSASEGVMILQVARTGDVRSWPLPHFVSLARSLERLGRPHLLLSGPAEADCGRWIEQELPPSPLRRHWVGQGGLRELAAFFTTAARRARLLSCDSGPMHLAAACGMPVTCLSGPQSHLRTGPWPVPGRAGSLQAHHRVVRSPSPPVCSPCLKRRCSHPRGPVCMSELPMETVLRSTDETT